MTKLVQIDFRGDLLWATRVDGEVYVAVKPICEAIGVQWEAQLKRIKRDAILGEGMSIMDTPSRGGVQDAVCLPLRLLNGWLFGIDERRIADPAARAKVLAYKRECYDVLFRHFVPAGPVAAVPPAPAVSEVGYGWDLPVQVLNAQARVIAEVRAVYGTEAARRMWERSGLPQVIEAGGDDSAMADPVGCLSHLLRYTVVKRAMVIDLIDAVLAGATDDLLPEIGILVDPPGFSGGIAVADRGAALETIFGMTAWRGGGWRLGLLGLLGARALPRTYAFNGRERRAVLVPMAHVNQVKAFGRKVA